MTASRTPLFTLGAGLALLATLTLSGCSAPAATSADPAGGTPSAASSSDASAPVALPDGFPTADVPLIPGTIVAANHPGNTWAVRIASSDLPGDLAKATQLLVDAGYANVIATAEYGDFHGSKYQVHVVAKVDPRYGSTVLYTFYAVQ